MSELYFRGSRAPGMKSLCRRYHDLGGTDYEYIASLPDASAEALDQGGSIRLSLRPDFEQGKAPWILEVIRGDEVLPGCYVGDDAKSVLLQEPDRIPVFIQDEEVALARRDLQIAKITLEEKRQMMKIAEERVSEAQERLSSLVGSFDIRLSDKYRITGHEGGEVSALRNGDAWRTIFPNDPVIAVINRLVSLENEARDLGIDTTAYVDIPSGYGPGMSDPLLVDLEDGSLRQTGEGHVILTRNGEDLDITGDGLALCMGYRIEELVEHIKAHHAPTADQDEAPGL